MTVIGRFIRYIVNGSKDKSHTSLPFHLRWVSVFDLSVKNILYESKRLYLEFFAIAKYKGQFLFLERFPRSLEISEVSVEGMRDP